MSSKKRFLLHCVKRRPISPYRIDLRRIWIYEWNQHQLDNLFHWNIPVRLWPLLLMLLTYQYLLYGFGHKEFCRFGCKNSCYSCDKNYEELHELKRDWKNRNRGAFKASSCDHLPSVFFLFCDWVVRCAFVHTNAKVRTVVVQYV